MRSPSTLKSLLERQCPLPPRRHHTRSWPAPVYRYFSLCWSLWFRWVLAGGFTPDERRRSAGQEAIFMSEKPSREQYTVRKPDRTRTKSLTLRFTSLLAIAGFLVTGVSSSAEETEAYWNDSEYAAAGELTAITVDAPQNLTCDSSFLVGNVWLEWDPPPEDQQPSYVVEVRHIISGDTNRYEIDESDYQIQDDGSIRLVLSRNLLQRLLGNLLGLGGNFLAR